MKFILTNLANRKPYAVPVHKIIKRLEHNKIDFHILDIMYDYEDDNLTLNKQFFNNIINSLHESMDDK